MSFWCPLLTHADPEEEMLQKQRVASLNDEREEVTTAKEALKSTLAAINPKGTTSPRKIITSDDRQVFYGDLFHNQQICALVELPFQDEEMGIGVGFALWTGKRWEIRNLFKIAPIWKPRGWKKEEGEYMPITPAESPFWIMRVTPDKPPLAVMVGMIWKYWQEHYLAKYDSASRSLILIAEDKDPTPVGGYLRLHGDSGHRAVYSDWTFCRWTGERLIPKGFWYDGMDRAETQSELHAASYDNQGKEMADYSITTPEPNKPSEDIYSISVNDHAPYATVKILWQKTIDPDTEGMAAGAYLFEKLTGLPRDLFPEGEESKKSQPLEKLATIKVTGSKDAVKKLSPKKRIWPF
jgi:hypothetical protein